MRTNQNGRSMIEMLGVLAIIGVLTVGGIIGYTKAMAKYRANKVVDQATMFITQIRAMYAAQQTYNHLTNALAINLGLAPDELVQRDADGVPTGVLRNAFSGVVQVGASQISADDANNNAFVVSFFGLSRDACIAVATSDWGSGSSSGLVGIHVWDQGSSPAANTTAATGTAAVAAGTSHTEEANATLIDAYIHGKYKKDVSDASITSGKGAGKGVYFAPGVGKYTVPLTIDQAMTACECTSKATCAVSWKYY
jgi:type II secretory pathway pseudopilin PulG